MQHGLESKAYPITSHYTAPGGRISALALHLNAALKSVNVNGPLVLSHLLRGGGSCPSGSVGGILFFGNTSLLMQLQHYLDIIRNDVILIALKPSL